ncbi:MAG TPA: polysaccharide deacetylase family protein [Alphaproteobacteria bacterium]|nr:polysaccharide deacetylase family protein [Alphaproteobacteria bacterium]
MSNNLYPVVPVYMLHSVLDHSRSVPYGHLSTPFRTFINIISYLHKHHFNTVTLGNLYHYLSVGEPLPPNPIVLTFDDGYLDNWVNVFPVLQRYGMKATIFVAPDFVDPREHIRPTLFDVWRKRTHIKELSYAGFLSWNEMKEMECSGLIDIQSHSLSHTYHFQTDEIIDFHHPGDPYPWLAWNQCPDRKYRWAYENQEELVAFGAPVYGYGRALAAPQYFPDASLTQILQEYVQKHGGRSFFQNPHWRDDLFGVAKAYTDRHALNARYESQREYEERVQHELRLSKEIIEKALSKTVQFLCWPGGAFNQTTLRLAEKAGYLATTKGTSKNSWGADPRRIARIGGRAALTRNQPVLDKYVGRLVFAAQVEAYRGHPLYSRLLRWSLTTVHTCRRLLGVWKGSDR